MYKMWRHYLATLCFGLLLFSCHGQASDPQNFQELLNKCVAGVTAIESQLAAIKQYQEKMFRRLENNVQKDLDKTENKLSTKIESVEKELKSEMRDRGTTVEKTVREALTKVVNGQQLVAEWTDSMEKNVLENIQMQMLQVKDMLKQRFGTFADHFGNDQSEEILDQLRDELANFSQKLFMEVPNILHSTSNSSNEPIPCNRNETKALTCHQLRKEGVTYDGKYLLHLDDQIAPFYAYCDMSDDGGGWTVIMRRGDYGEKRTSFDQNWNQYRNGFGILEQEFWMGNEKIHALTSTGKFELRVDLTAFDGDVLRIMFGEFRVRDEENGYRLRIGDANRPLEGSSLQMHNGRPFSTRDRNHDISSKGDCPSKHKCGWWFGQCFSALLTGPYFRKEEEQPKMGIRWAMWKGGAIMKSAEMKIRPKDFR